MDSSCAWLQSENRCAKLTPATSIDAAAVSNLDQCPTCGDRLTCQSCLEGRRDGAGDCEWQKRLGRCVRRWRSYQPSQAVRKRDSCPPPCHERSGCGECVSSDDCVWCESASECFAFSSYLTRFAYGRCSSWTDRFKLSSSEEKPASGDICQECSAAKECSSCVRRLGCGWCHLKGDPMVGVCQVIFICLTRICVLTVFSRNAVYCTYFDITCLIFLLLL